MPFGVCCVRVSSLVVVALALAGCNAADLKTPIGGFALATKSAQESLNKQQTSLDAAILDKSLSVAGQDQAPVITSNPGDCKQTASRCRLFIKFQGRDWPFTKGKINHGVLELMAGVSSYADNLNAIANSDSAAKIQTALGETKASILSIAGTIDKLGGVAANSSGSLSKTATAYAGPLTDLVAFGLQRYTEMVKIRALREGVDQMELVFPDLVRTFDRLSTDATEIRLAVLDIKFINAYDAYVAATTNKPKAVADLRAAADEYDTALQSTPIGMFRDLQSAHTALADALNHRNLSFAELWPYLQSVLDQAAKFATLVKQLEDAGAKT